MGKGKGPLQQLQGWPSRRHASWRARRSLEHVDAYPFPCFVGTIQDNLIDFSLFPSFKTPFTYLFFGSPWNLSNHAKTFKIGLGM